MNTSAVAYAAFRLNVLERELAYKKDLVCKLLNMHACDEASKLCLKIQETCNAIGDNLHILEENMTDDDRERLNPFNENKGP